MDQLKVLDDGQIGLYVLKLPEELIAENEYVDCFVVPVMKRNAGFLAAIPSGYIREEVLIAGNTDAAMEIVGPSL